VYIRSQVIENGTGQTLQGHRRHEYLDLAKFFSISGDLMANNITRSSECNGSELRLWYSVRAPICIWNGDIAAIENNAAYLNANQEIWGGYRLWQNVCHGA
jgi:hypothetical protein